MASFNMRWWSQIDKKKIWNVVRKTREENEECSEEDKRIK